MMEESVRSTNSSERLTMLRENESNRKENSKNDHILLQRIFLLNLHMPEFHIECVILNGQMASLPPDCQLWEKKENDVIKTMSIMIAFMSKSFGNFEQDLMFEFDEGTKIIRHIGVQVAPESRLMETLQFKPNKEIENELVWIEKYNIVPFDGESKPTFKNLKYPLPPNIDDLVSYGAFDHLDKNLTRNNYKKRLHLLLHIEEFERRRHLQKLSFTIDQIEDFIHDPIPGLHKNRVIKIPCDDHHTEQGYQLIGKSGKAFVKLTNQTTGNCQVYELLLEQILSNEFVFEMSEKLDSYLQDNTTESFRSDFCFRFVDVFQFMHRAIDNIYIDDVFPFHSPHHKSTWSTYKYKGLSKEQSTALNKMIERDRGPPILILGPFGSGKTRTMATAVMELLKDMKFKGEYDKRILICTHSNSAADHYIEDFIDPFLQQEKFDSPILIRVNWELRYTASVSATVLNYCEVKDGRFAQPTKEEIEKYHVVVSTLVTADLLSQLGISRDFFTHIFIDEAAQAMEVEAIIPLVLKGELTKVILAGDHLQLGFPLSSPTAKNIGLGISLLERLFQDYSHESSYKLKLLENFRSFKEIVEISSSLFYEGALIANKSRPPDINYPLRFYGIHGKEEVSKYHPSLYNLAEANEVLYRIQDLQKNWPASLEKLTSSNICVLSSFSAQIQEIRLVLRRNGLSGVRVENVNNVQGLEFDVVVISTVQSYTTLSKRGNTDDSDLGFLGNPKLFNTAITRAKYFCIFVAEPVALCSFGACKALWKTLLASCHQQGEFHYRLSFDEVIDISDKLRETLHQDVNRSTRAQSLLALYEEEQTLHSKDDIGKSGKNEMRTSDVAEDIDSVQDEENIWSFAGTDNDRLPGIPKSYNSSSINSRIAHSVQMSHHETSTTGHPVIGSRHPMNTAGRPATTTSRHPIAVVLPMSETRLNMNSGPSHQSPTHELLPQTVYQYNTENGSYSPVSHWPASSHSAMPFSPNKLPGATPVFRTTPQQNRSTTAQPPDDITRTFSELEICNSYIARFLQYLSRVYPHVYVALQAFSLKLEETSFEAQRLMHHLNQFPLEYASEKLRRSSSVYIELMSKVDELLMQILPDISIEISAHHSSLYTMIHEAFVDLKLSLECLSQEATALVMNNRYDTVRPGDLLLSVTKLQSYVSFVLMQLSSCVRPLLGVETYPIQKSLCNIKLTFLSIFLEEVKLNVMEVQRNIGRIQQMPLSVHMQSHAAANPLRAGLQISGNTSSSSSTGGANIGHARENWDRTGPAGAVFSGFSVDSSQSRQWKMTAAVTPSRHPERSTSNLSHSMSHTQEQNMLRFNPSNNQERLDYRMINEENEKHLLREISEEVKWHLHDESDETEASDMDLIRDTVSELLQLTSDVPYSSHDNEVENLTKLIHNLRQQDNDVDEWFVDRQSDPFVREYIASFERHRAMRVPSPSDASATEVSSMPIGIDVYKMNPKYQPYSEQNSNQFEGMIYFERSVTIDKPVGVIMKGNQRIYFPDLRSINRSLNGDRVLYEIICIHDHHVIGRITSVIDRRGWSVVCKKSLTDNCLMLPLDERGPPIIVFNASKACASIQRSAVGSEVRKFVVNIIGWPVEMMYPIGMIERDAQEHEDK